MTKHQRDERLAQLERSTENLGRLLARTIEETNTDAQKTGFALLVFDLNEQGWMTYFSNAERASMIKAMKECTAKLEAGIDTPPGAPITVEH